MNFMELFLHSSTNQDNLNIEVAANNKAVNYSVVVMTTHIIKKLTENDDIFPVIKTEFLNEYCEGYVLIGEDETCMPQNYEEYVDAIKDFKVYDSDVWVCSFPKSGTTWIQEMVWLIEHKLDFEGAKTYLIERFPFFETCTLYDFEKLDKLLGVESIPARRNSLEYCRQQQHPRCIKTHLPFYLLPAEIQNGSKSPKIIYITRNPKDVCVSYCHHGKVVQGWKADMDDFSKVFLSDKITYGPYWKHVLGFWNNRHLSNLMLVTYEDMKHDLPLVIKKVATFLNKKLEDEQIEILCKHLSFESMKSNKSVNYEHMIDLKKQRNMLYEDGSFIRSGIVGKYKEEMPTEIVKKFDAWITENIAGTDFGQQYNYNL